MTEVQCFDGDGAVPPELQALLKENARLKELLEDRDVEIATQKKESRNQDRIIREMSNKLYQIEMIINLKVEEEEEPIYPVYHPVKGKGDPTDIDMSEKVPIKDAIRRAKDYQTVNEMFDGLMRQDRHA